MSFSINFVGPANIGFELGKITIGDFEEIFESSLSYWSIRDYESHWKGALQKIIIGDSRSCLITSLYNPDNANFLIWWPIYRDGDIVYIQNQILLFKNLPTRFSIDDPYSFVKDRMTLNDDGAPISEWNTSVEEIEYFMRQ